MSKKIKVGIFLVGGIVLFCIGLFLIGSREQLFGQHFTVYTQFTNLNTLQSGAKVRVSGMAAGEVTAIDVPKEPGSPFRLRLKVDEKFRPVVREDSTTSIETEGMVGNQFVNIKMGSANSPECEPGCMLKSQEPVSVGELMQQGNKIATSVEGTIDDLHHRADTAMENITSLTGQANAMMTTLKPDVQKIGSNVVQATSNANAIVAGVRQGRGTAGKLLTDEKVAQNVDDTIANAKQTSANADDASRKVNEILSQVQTTDLAEVDKTLKNTQDMTQQLDDAVGTFLSKGNSNETTAEALRGAVHGAQQTMTNLSDDTEAIKHNFFFRGFFNRRGYYNMDTITPEKYVSSPFVRKARARVWIPAAGLFTVGSNGTQELSDSGRSILDKSMSDLVPFLPNNPLVIEGYSENGLPDQQYLASRERALAVRQYLESRFHLKSSHVGIMPLGNHPPPGAQKTTWDGVCLALVVSRK